jgi:hypothetical protein
LYFGPTLETTLNYSSEKDGKLPITPVSSDVDAAEGFNRRKFTRNAVAGSAMFFSLSNRPAWSNVCLDTVSTGFMNSATHNSHDPEGVSHNLYQSKVDAWDIMIDENNNAENPPNILSRGPHPSDSDKACLKSEPNPNYVAPTPS